MRRTLLLVATSLFASSVAIAGPIADDAIAKVETALAVDVQTGRLIGVSSSGPRAEVGVKIAEALYGDYTAGEWTSYVQAVDGDYQKPAVTKRLVVLGRDGELLLDQEDNAANREALTRQIDESRRKAELLTADRHIPDYLLRPSSISGLVHVNIEKSEPYDRGGGNLSVTHTGKVKTVLFGDFKPGQAIEITESTNRKKRVEAPANKERIVLVNVQPSLKDGKTKNFAHNKANYGYSEDGLKTLQADVARVHADAKK
jgi:hypothetical protein